MRRAAIVVITACSLLAAQGVAASAVSMFAVAQMHVAEVNAAVPPIPGGQAVTSPVRILDTVHKVGLRTAIPAHATLILPMPHSEPAAWTADLRIKVVRPRASGQITVSWLPDLSQAFTGVSFATGHTVANLAVVLVSGDDNDHGSPDTAYLRNDSAKAVNLVVDFMGYTASQAPLLAGLTDLAQPQRLLDTASGVGSRQGAIPPRGSVAFLAAGPNLHSLPGRAHDNAAAALLEVTAASPRSTGALAAAADRARRPATFDVSFTRGLSTTNLVEVPIGADDKIRLYNESAGAVHATVDIVGYYQRQHGNPSWTGAFHQLTSRRLFDTRRRLRASAIPAHRAEQVKVTGVDGVSATRTAAVLMNLTTVAPAASGSLQATAGGSRRPIGSSVLIRQGTTTSSEAMIPVSRRGTIELYNTSSRPVQVLGDIKGYYLNPRPTVANALPTWSTVTLPQPAGSPVSYTATSCAASDFCALIGYQAGTTNDYVTTVQGSHVTSQHVLPQITPDIGNNAGRGTIACTSSSFCITDLSGDGSYQFDGQSWSAVPGPAPFGPLACGTPRFCIALNGGNDERFDGTQWTSIPGPNFPNRQHQDQPTTGLSCRGANFCMAVGEWGDTSVYRGGAWQRSVRAYSPFGRGIDSLSCASPTRCVMLDTDGNVTTYTNGQWGTPYNIAYGGWTTSNISCPSTRFCVVSGGDYALTHTTAGWSTHGTIYDSDHNTYNAIACATPTYCLGTDPGQAVVSQ